VGTVIKQNSRQRFTAVISNADPNGRKLEYDYSDLRPCLVNNKSPDNRSIIPQQGDNWSRIAWRSLGNGRLYWVIADYSVVLDPFTELQPTSSRTILSELKEPIGQDNAIVPARPWAFKRGMQFAIEDLSSVDAQGNPTVVYETVALGVDKNGVVSIPNIQGLAGMGLDVNNTRITEVWVKEPKLVAPSLAKAYFRATDFANPLNTLVL